ncbi:NUDIX hydrolase [Pyrobaculum islandicum DSM 4184]|uniref:NUDIX hydrolase n=1 Tax=Pyrobaculum islandicum (strain DSM 4184 / JCM 9189 / GEO3) TaxID=384616 RepID=A1RQN1_PYRIL|nr:CoA pyrophosphatase [Pyrobaculum islandicum]ABL87263.1 NUDIX hydrolase [Pyrobaculum islandicum DSM 4184]
MCLLRVNHAGGPDWAAVGVLLRSGKVLLIKRVERDGDPWSGHVAFPGGRWRPGEDLLGTAVREIEEEVSIQVTDVAGALPPFSPGNAPWLKVVPFIFTGWVGEPRPNPREVREARWVGRDELREITWGGEAAFETGGWIIWGLTYRILKKLIDCGLF